MMNKLTYIRSKTSTLLAIFSMIFIATSLYAEKLTASYLYNLSDFKGTINYSWPRLSADSGKNEIYVAYQSYVRIFNDNGMEIYRFEGTDFGSIYDLTVDNDGNIIILSYKGENYLITLCNFRGDPKSKIELKDIPTEYADMHPNRLIYRDGFLYLADFASMKIIVTDTNGLFKNGYDISALLGFDKNKEEAEDAGLGGFSIDSKGNIAFTIPVIARAYLLFPDLKIISFGKRGSTQGKFGVTGGITADDKGFYYVADILRCVIIVFDKDFNFQTEFGYRGFKDKNLIAPTDLAIDGRGRIYVTQGRNRGISVFNINYRIDQNNEEVIPNKDNFISTTRNLQNQEINLKRN